MPAPRSASPVLPLGVAVEVDAIVAVRGLTRSIRGRRASRTAGCITAPAFRKTALIAFAAALELGAGIECDLRLTADDQILVFHDADAWRMCASHAAIGRSSTHAELSRLRVGDGPIPTLESLLALVDGRVPLLLEVKVDGDIWRWAPALKRALRELSTAASES